MYLIVYSIKYANLTSSH